MNSSSSASHSSNNPVWTPTRLAGGRLLLLLLFFGAAPLAYGGSQAWGQIEAVATGLRQSHSNAGSERVSAAYTTAHGNARSFNPLRAARDRTHILMDTSWVCFHRFNAIPIKLPMTFFTDLEQTIQTCIGNHTRPRTANAIVRSKHQAGGVTLPDLRLNDKATVIETAWSRYQSRQTDNGTEQRSRK